MPFLPCVREVPLCSPGFVERRLFQCHGFGFLLGLEKAKLRFLERLKVIHFRPLLKVVA